MAARKKKQQMPNYISVKVSDELYELIAKAADEEGCAMIDIVVKAVAENFGRPELGYVPRKPQGRKRSKFPALNGSPR